MSGVRGALRRFFALAALFSIEKPKSRTGSGRITMALRLAAHGEQIGDRTSFRREAYAFGEAFGIAQADHNGAAP
jgi:hypothetical protein